MGIPTCLAAAGARIHRRGAVRLGGAVGRSLSFGAAPGERSGGRRRERDAWIIPSIIPTTNTIWTLRAHTVDIEPHVSGLRGSNGQRVPITQIYEGTNQIQRVVIARSLLK